MLRADPGRSAILVAGLLAAMPVAPAFAQPALRDRPSQRELEQPEYLPPAEPDVFELPPVEEPGIPDTTGRTVQVDAYVFEGNKVVDTATLQKIAEPYRGRQVDLAELEALRVAITRHYIDQGYINSGALLLEDFYRDGVVRFHIVEGRLSDIRIGGLGRLRESYVKQRLTRPDEPLDVDTLQERFQLLLTDPLIAKVNARLEPGAEPGEAVLDLDVTRARPWDLSLYFNNYQAPSVGAEVIGATGVLRNLTGLGDTLQADLAAGIEKGRYGLLSWRVPVVYRTDLFARYQREKTSVVEEPLDRFDLDSDLETYEVGISHALLDSIRRRLSFDVLYTHRENTTTAFDEPIPLVPGEPTGTSKVDAWRFAQDYTQRGGTDSFAARSIFTWGRTNVQENLATPEVVPAQHYFTWIGQAQYARLLADNGTNLLVRGTVQLSPDRLVPMERFALGGIYAVRGYRENQVVRDQGYAITLELRYPLLSRPAEPHHIYLVPFFDAGEAWNRGEEHQALRSVGLGINWEFRRLFAELYYGVQLVDLPVEASGDLQDDGIHFQVRYAF
jgi:hemolysin activation/secretion protein